TGTIAASRAAIIPTSKHAGARGNRSPLNLMSMAEGTEPAINMDQVLRWGPVTDRWDQVTKGRRTITGLKAIRALRTDMAPMIKAHRTDTGRTTRDRQTGMVPMIRGRRMKDLRPGNTRADNMRSNAAEKSAAFVISGGFCD